MRDHKRIQKTLTRQYKGQWTAKKKAPEKSKTKKKQQRSNERKKANLQGLEKPELQPYVQRCHRMETRSHRNLSTAYLLDALISEHEHQSLRLQRLILDKSDVASLVDFWLQLCQESHHTVTSKYGYHDDSHFDRVFGMFRLHLGFENEESTLKVLMKESLETLCTSRLQRLKMETQNELGYTILHYACLFDLPATVLNLIKSGADFSIRDKEGNQPLHIAATHASWDIIEALLSSGADCFSNNSKGVNPLELTIKEGRNDVACTLIHNLKDQIRHHPLCLAIQYGSGNLVEKILATINMDTFFCKVHQMPILAVALINPPNIASSATIIISDGGLFQPKRSQSPFEVLFEHIEGFPGKNKKSGLTS